MINGLSKHTHGAAKAIAYLVDDLYFEEAPTPENPRAGTWRTRDPKPEWIEGDANQLVALCESLNFKHKYTTGVLSFNQEETARIYANPGMKEEIIKDLKEFAYAGVKSDDCKPMFINQHTHKGRLEINYLIPRVSLESGKYFNPFPPNYDGRKGNGANNVFKECNDIFVDYVCSKYGLQNPRDPRVAREIKISKFDPHRVDKKIINDKVGKLIDSGWIKSREDIIDFLERAGGTITRKGSDYLSVRFDDNKKAIRLKGEYYGEQSYAEITARIDRASEKLARTPSEFKEAYEKVLSERAGHVEKRHELKGLAAERSESFDRKSSSELKHYAHELQAITDSLPDAVGFSRRVNDFIVDSPEIAGAVRVGGFDGGVAPSDVEPILTGDPASDRLIRAFHNMQKKLAAEELQRTKERWQINPHHEKMIREISDTMTKLFGGLSLGKNLVHGRPGAMTPAEIGQVRQMLQGQRRELDRELKAVAQVVRKKERIEPLQKLLEPQGHWPTSLPPHLFGIMSSGLEESQDGIKKALEERRRAARRDLDSDPGLTL